MPVCITNIGESNTDILYFKTKTPYIGIIRVDLRVRFYLHDF